MELENIPRFENEEQELRWILNELHKDYQRRIAPILKRLSKIDAAKPLPPVDVSDYDMFNLTQLQQLLAKFRKDWGHS
ncbi:hypothetical protein [Caballeronia sp. LZ034LL]|uniref:hypothetical protein n=1 Tax=Caballeronia sp. LZ034LL TaxID=3038567 RepID=UPI0028594E53|nr:hypothetical protein [Caballeronia sp. LZ034LL]MDR5839358.1 hypothetical protein [Caballeronia sp. LZ034LL]